MTVQMDRETVSPFVELARRRAALEVAQLDYRRELKALLAEGRKQTDIARALHISQPAVSKAAKVAANVPEPAPGFSGAGPYEICQRYATGLIDRDRVVDELSRWEYTPIPQGEWYEDVLADPGPGSWFEVQEARRGGLIDGTVYEDARKGRPQPRQRSARAA